MRKLNGIQKSELKEILLGVREVRGLGRCFRWSDMPQGHEYWSARAAEKEHLTEEDLNYLNSLLGEDGLETGYYIRSFDIKEDHPYLKKGKLYRAVRASATHFSFWLVWSDGKEERHFGSFRGCAHLDGGDWELIEIKESVEEPKASDEVYFLVFSTNFSEKYTTKKEVEEEISSHMDSGGDMDITVYKATPLSVSVKTSVKVED